jgi:DNA-binding MarR family transcriptional regulator
MDNTREILQTFVRRFGLLNASCSDVCCGEKVSLAQSHILCEIRKMGNPSMQQVADELGMDITTFSRQVKTLTGKGFVTRTAAPGDRRVGLLSLTSEGEQTLRQIDAFITRKLEELFSPMSDFERQVVTASLSRLTDALRSGFCCD